MSGAAWQGDVPVETGNSTPADVPDDSGIARTPVAVTADDDPDLPSWRDEPLPDWATDPERQSSTYAVGSLSIGLSTEPGAPTDLARYAEVLQDLNKYFGMPLKIVAPIANVGTVRMDLDRPIDAAEAVQRCHRLTRFGLAASCRPLSPAGGLM